MSYPALPFALVHMLSNVTPERAALPDQLSHISVFAQHGTNCSSIRLQISEEWQYPEVEAAIARICAGQPIQTISLFYSTNDPDPIDIGIIIEQGADDMVVHWRFAPIFNLVLDESAAQRANLMGSPGIELARKLLGNLR